LRRSPKSDETVRAISVAFEMTRAALHHGPSADLSPKLSQRKSLSLRRRKRGTQTAMPAPDALPKTRVAQDEYDALQAAPPAAENRRKIALITAIQAKSCAAE
jgi:hypothetical protein